MSDPLTCCVVGGFLCGMGTGIILRAGGSTGGFDILAVYLAKKSKKISVGMALGILNGLVYVACAFMLDLQTAIFSLIFAAVTSYFVDKFDPHEKNCTVFIITKQDDLKKNLMTNLNRGLTTWEAKGGRSFEDKHIYFMVISEFELESLKKIITSYDENAFVAIIPETYVQGNFLQKIG